MRASRRAVIILLAALCFAPLPVLAQGGTTTAWFGRDVVVSAGETVHGDLMAFGGHVHVMPGGTVDGNVITIGSDTTIEGHVAQDVVGMGGTIALTEGATVMGDVVVLGTLQRAEGAVVRGNVVHGLGAMSRFRDLPWGAVVPPVSQPSEPSPAAGTRAEAGTGSALLGNLGVLVVVMLMAALVATLLPGALGKTADVARDAWGISLGIGLLTALLVAVLAVISALLALVCVGLPLLLALVIALFLAGLVGWSAAGLIVGRYLAPLLGIRRPTFVLETALGTGIITLAAMIPWLGWLVALVLLCSGIGAAILANTGALRGLSASPYHVAEAAAPPGAAGTHRGDTKPLDTSRWPFVPDDHDAGAPH